jgi:hypothetical protein
MTRCPLNRAPYDPCVCSIRRIQCPEPSRWPDNAEIWGWVAIALFCACAVATPWVVVHLIVAYGG